MEKSHYYKTLAEKIFFNGINSKEVLDIANYKPDKSFSDLANAVRNGRLQGLGQIEREFRCIAGRLSDVIEIDTERFDKVYGKPDEDDII